MSLPHTLLGILDWTPLHGYALRELARGYAWIHPTTNANIYPALRKLETEGLVCHREEVRDGRLRKVYRVTEAGRSELLRWLADPADPHGVYRDPVLLKICLLREGGYAESRTWIADGLARLQAAIRETERTLEDQGDRLPKYTRLVAEHGLDILRLRAHCFERVLKELEVDGAPPPAPGG